MALGDPYVSVAELKVHAQVADPLDDTALTSVVAAVSRSIERFCGRQFNKATTATARLYRPAAADRLLVDDFWSTSDLVIATDTGAGTYPTTLATSDVTLEPLNGVVGGTTGFPWREIIRHSGSFTTNQALPSVRVTAKWGWNAVPDDVFQAALIQSARLFSRRYSTQGLVGQGEFVFRVSNQLDPDVQQLLHPYVVHALVA